MILAGDVGGTKTLLGLFRRSGNRLLRVRERSFASREFRSLESIVDAFLTDVPEATRVHSAAVGVAGPVVGGRTQVVNLRWPVDERRLARRLGTRAVRVLNDVEATAWGIPALPRSRLVDLTPRLRARPGNAALIAAGTGLGMALMVWDGRQRHPSASEGGHQAFGPRDDLELELARFLRRRHGRASVERAVSGPGLLSIYAFLAERGGGRESRALRRRLAEAEDPNAAIAEAGLAGDDRLAGRALDLFVSLLGAAAGDLALVARATGGLYVAGGIAPKILPKLRSRAFLQAFRDKGRLSSFLRRVPVRVILEPRTALFGAARCAVALAEAHAGRGSLPGKRRR
jgi:glucokinase